ncbi:putative membrane lipoprotein [Abeliophyllum distichum]|uniref:non-specific serine/threonine protein kinase n=1 Tax=Abeliophyllum distichum TaxID=126358 RepID=A0ABD1U385_9LAMI
MKIYSIFLSSFLLIFPCLISSQTCQKSCGKIPIKYPFGTGPGCGDPHFQPYVTCNDQQQLTFTTHTGCYPIISIDYNHQIIYITDTSMSTCGCKLPSKGFSLDWNAPFSFSDDTIFALLDCSTSSSPIYKSITDDKNSTFPLCDSKGDSICSLLYSCEAISRLSLPISTCCVYTPVDLGPSFEMDLQKLQCTSYSAVYGFNGQEYNPQGWQYGVALKYKFNFDNDYPVICSSCEKSNGVCGYNNAQQFLCNCPGGLNTTTDCFYGDSWSHGSKISPLKSGTMLIFSFTWFIILAFIQGWMK